jgi:hypothetical protein
MVIVRGTTKTTSYLRTSRKPVVQSKKKPQEGNPDRSLNDPHLLLPPLPLPSTPLPVHHGRSIPPRIYDAPPPSAAAVPVEACGVDQDLR